MSKFGSDDSYDNDPMLQSPAPARSEGFTFDGKGFHVDGIARQSLVRIRLSQFPKEWYTAQLMLYGVPFVKTAGAQELLKTLESARKAGKTKTPTNAVVQMEQRLKAAYTQNIAAHAKAAEAWRDRKFARLPGAAEELSFDKPRFFAKYFLDENRQPAPSKSRDGISFRNGIRYRSETDLGQHVAAIPGLAYLATSELTVFYWEKDRERALDKAFDSISTWFLDTDLQQGRHNVNVLATCEASHDAGRFLSKYFSDRSTTETITVELYREKSDRLYSALREIPELHAGEVAGMYGFIVVGWGESIYPPLYRMEAEWEREQQEKEAEKRRRKEEEAEEERKMREQRLEPHREYIQHCTRPFGARGALELAHLTGTYILELASKKLIDNYELDDDKFLSVCAPRSRHGCVAAFDIGLVRGTMLLALSEEDVHALAKGQAGTASYAEDDDDEGDYDDDEEEEEEEEEDDDDDYYGGLGKRAARSQHGPQPTVRLKLDAEPRPGRVYFQWAGRECGDEGQLQLDSQGRQAGFIDFDKSGCTATGILKYASMFGNNDAGISFSIYKTSDTPEEEPEPWSRFTQEQYEYERKARWH